MLAQILRIARKDLKLRMRDRSVFIIGIAAPAMLALIFSSVFGDILGPGDGFSTSYGLVDLDDSEPSRGLGQVLEQLGDTGQFNIIEYESTQDAEAGIEADAISSAFVIGSGFATDIIEGGAVVEVVGDVDAPISTSIATAVAEGYADTVDRVALTVAASLAAGADPSSLGAIAERAATTGVGASLGAVDVEVRQMDAVTYVMAGMAVFFLFFTVQFGVASLLEEKRLGTWSRLMASPTSRGVVIAAKAFVSFVLGVVSMAVLMIGASIGLGARWGDPVAVALLVVLGVLAATGVMSLVSAFARTEEGAGNIQSIVAVTFGMLGGTFFPIVSDGGLISRLSLLTPHAWFLRGLNELAGGGGVERIIPSLVAIGGFALVTGAIALLAFQREGAI